MGITSFYVLKVTQSSVIDKMDATLVTDVVRSFADVLDLVPRFSFNVWPSGGRDNRKK
jgi:hypothetical protein